MLVGDCRAAIMGAGRSSRWASAAGWPKRGARRSVGQVGSLEAGDAERRVGDSDSVRQEVGDVTAFEERLGDDDEVLAGVDPMSDAGGDDGQDVGDPFTASVLPREQPIATPENELSKLAFAAIVRQGDVPIFEKQK